MSEEELIKKIGDLEGQVAGLSKSSDDFSLHEHGGYDSSRIAEHLVVSQTFGVTVYTNASIGNEKVITFYFTATSNFTMANPTNCINGKRIIYKIKQDGTGSRIVTWGSAFRGSTSLSLPALTTSANFVDYIGFIYDASVGKWNCLAINLGFAT